MTNGHLYLRAMAGQLIVFKQTAVSGSGSGDDEIYHKSSASSEENQAVNNKSSSGKNSSRLLLPPQLKIANTGRYNTLAAGDPLTFLDDDDGGDVSVSAGQLPRDRDAGNHRLPLTLSMQRGFFRW